jgi:hypothetical protein
MLKKKRRRIIGNREAENRHVEAEKDENRTSVNKFNNESIRSRYMFRDEEKWRRGWRGCHFPRVFFFFFFFFFFFSGVQASVS